MKTSLPENSLVLTISRALLAVPKLSAAADSVSVESSTTAGHRARVALRPLLLAIGDLAILLAAAPVRAQVLPPGGNYYGKTYGQWSEAFYQWAFSLPVSGHPLFDPTQTSADQTGPVWFLMGSLNLANSVTTNVVRYATIQGAEALFIDLVDESADNTDCSGSQRISDGYTEAQLRAICSSILGRLDSLSCTIDGVAVAGLTNLLTSPYLVPSPTPGGFSYTVPGMDNILEENDGEPCWSNDTGAPISVSASVYHPVAEGYYLLLAPLPPGQHTIYEHAQGGTPARDVYNTWYLTVTPVTLSVAPQGTNVVLSWPQTAFTNVLESTISLESPNWSSVDAAKTALGDTYQVTLPVGPSNMFFRLRQSP